MLEYMFENLNFYSAVILVSNKLNRACASYICL